MLRPWDRRSGRSRLVYGLEAPRLDEVAGAAEAVFSGWVFYYGDRVIREVRWSADRARPVVATVDGARPELVPLVPRVAAAGRSGFAVRVPIPAACRTLRGSVRFADGGRARFVRYDVAALRRERARLEGATRALAGLPVPDGDLTFLTQGTREPESYRRSVVPVAFGVGAYLAAAGIADEPGRRILDFGCGSGRLLSGWWLLGHRGPLAGCDLNPELIAWAQANLPAAIRFDRTELLPPLPYADAAFDLVTALSVFTHLGWETASRWAAELRRVLRPGGLLLLTTHGESYVRHALAEAPAAVSRFRARGFATVGEAEGSNRFAAFHTAGGLRRLFPGFRLRAFFPHGRLRGYFTPFPPAALQDVALLQRTG